MKLRGNKYWELLKDNTEPCSGCQSITPTAMRGKTEKNHDKILCSRCVVSYGEEEKENLAKIKAILKFIRHHLISISLIFVVIVAADIGIIDHFIEKNKTNTVRVITDWAYPKVNMRVSRVQVEKTVRAHYQYSTKPKHTLAIVMAESRFFPGATNDKCKDAWGGGQVRWKVWKEQLMDAGIIQTDERDLFDIEVTARAVSYVLDHYMSLLPNDLRTPGLKITYALTMYVGDMQGKKIVSGLAKRNKKLNNSEVRSIIEKLDYPVEVLAYVGEMSALQPDTNVLQQIGEWMGTLFKKGATKEEQKED